MADTPQPLAPRRRGRTLGFCLLAVLVLLAGWSTANRQRLRLLYFAVNLFSGKEQVENFRSLDTIFPHTVIRRAGPVFDFDSAPGTLPDTYQFNSETHDLRQFLEETDTTALLVIKDDAVIFEEYYRGNTRDTKWISWSMAKSFVSALVGIAVADGRITSIEEPVTKYVPELVGSGYDGVRIKDILQMSSGVRWNEDYSDWNADINRFGRTLAFGGSFDEFCATLVRELEPGTYNRYVSMDTQVLGMLLVRATGQPLSAYLEQKIWQRIGMESDAYWIGDRTGMELALGGLNVTARDYAKFGRLYLHEGQWEGEEIVPAAWVRASVVPDAPHLQPGENEQSDWVMGYGYQWWIPENPDGEFMAIGVYQQFIYIYPRERLIIVKNSAMSDYGVDDSDESYREVEAVEVFRTIAAHLQSEGETHKPAGETESPEPATPAADTWAAGVPRLSQ